MNYVVLVEGLYAESHLFDNKFPLIFHQGNAWHLLQVVEEVTTRVELCGNIEEFVVLKNLLQLQDVWTAVICNFSHDIKLLKHLVVSCVHFIYPLLFDDLDCSFDI